jgi:hypothetical protein
MSRVTFYGFGAFVGSIRSLTECAWWDDDPVAVYNFSQAALVPVDLAMNLGAARAGKIPWADIQVDDHRQAGGLTTIGPMFPTGAMIGAAWLTETYWQKLPNKPPRQPASAPNDAYDYELTSYQYYGGEEGDRRFYGFHANVKAPNGSLHEVEIWDAGTGKIRGRAAAGTWWLDLKQVALDGGKLQLGAGPLFLDSGTAKTLMLSGPKRPLAWGAGTLP